MAILRWEPRNGGIECSGVGTNCDCWRMASYRAWLLDLVRSTVDSRWCSSVSQLRCTSVCGTETTTHQRMCQREEFICMQR